MCTFNLKILMKQFNGRQAGTELCQAKVNMGLAKLALYIVNN